MAITRKNPDVIAPPVGPYSHLVRVSSGVEWVFISGQVGLDVEGQMPPDAYSQTVNVFRNIERLLDSEGLGPASIVRLLTFVAGAEHAQEYRRASAAALNTWFPDGEFPGQSFTFAPALARPDVLVEVEAWAVVPPAPDMAG